jgi:hypothetical protein
MSEMVNDLIILNLAGALSEELSDYLVKKGARVIDPLTENIVLEWTHIFVRDLESFDAVGDTYGTLYNDIKLISLSQPRDLKNFMINNGKLVLDETWLLGPFGPFILDKFFQEFGGVNLSDNYPKFKELGSFNITNPFNTGEYLDHLVYNAFENGMSALSIKTYFDHLLMYLTSLKNKGRVGFPIEVSYGTFNDVYGLQMHFYSENMQIEDVTNSLTSSITKTPEEYLLYVSLQSSDFFDFTYLPEVNKVVITGLWTKDENVKTENKGMMFTHSLADSPVPKQVAEASMPFVLNEGEIEDMSSLVSPAGEVEIIPADIHPEEDEALIVQGLEPEEEHLQIISGSEEEEETVTKITGTPQEKESLTMVKGKKEEKDNFKVTLSGSKEEKPGNMTVRSIPGADSTGPGKFDFSERGTVKDGTASTSGNKKAAALFKVSGPSKREGDLEKKLTDTLNEKDQLKSKLMSAMSELKTQKETQLRIKKVNEEAAKIVIPDAPSKVEEILRVNASKSPVSERETKLAEEFREMEKLARKLQLEGLQKETRFTQELEKLQRMMVLKDSVVEKTKETYTKALEKKDQEIAGLLSKLEQVNKHMAGGGAQAQSTVIKELERQSQNQNKMIEMYRAKISTLSATIESSKVDDGQKEDPRKVQLLNEQLKTHLEMAKKEVTKLQERSSSDSAQLLILKQEKAKLIEAVKKAEQATRLNQNIHNNYQGTEVEAKRLQAQVQLLEQYLKDSHSKVKDLEMKLQTANAVNRNNVAAEDGQSKVKIGHLENSVKKLTQDLVESRNQLAEMKKETNKLRQEKTALQNMLDKSKKDLEKFEKKPATPGKKSA